VREQIVPLNAKSFVEALVPRAYLSMLGA